MNARAATVKLAMDELEPVMARIIAEQDLATLVGALASHLGFILYRMRARGGKADAEGVLAGLAQYARTGKGSVVPPE